MSTLKRLFRRIWDAYPKEPLVYVCSHNGVTGVVRAVDFDDEVRRMRRLFRREGRPQDAVRPQVNPVFLFSDKTSLSRSFFRVGTLDDLKQILEGCAVEQRTFELPSLNAKALTTFGLMKKIGFKNPRNYICTLEQAQTYLSCTDNL